MRKWNKLGSNKSVADMGEAWGQGDRNVKVTPGL